LTSTMYGTRVRLYNYTSYPVTGEAAFCKSVSGGRGGGVLDFNINGATVVQGHIKPVMQEQSWGNTLLSILVTVEKSATQSISLSVSNLNEGHPVWFEVRERIDSHGKSQLYLTYSKQTTNPQETDSNGHWIADKK
jgi:hypothetical protein